MKDKNHLIRLIIIIIIIGIGIFLTYQVYQFRFSKFSFDLFIFGVISLVGIIYWLWSLNKDFKKYKLTKKRKFLIGIISGFIFIGLVLGIHLKNSSNLNKPILIRVSYSGDFNGTSIDFKTDGTYVFDNYSIGFSDYIYGKYEMKGQLIILDKKEIDNVIESNLLEIKKKKINGTNESENYLFQIGVNGKEIERATQFKVVVDNRK